MFDWSRTLNDEESNEDDEFIVESKCVSEIEIIGEKGTELSILHE